MTTLLQLSATRWLNIAQVMLVDYALRRISGMSACVDRQPQ